MTATVDAFPEIPGFRVEAEIGRGAQARVFRARQDALDRVVALKVISAPADDEGSRKALRLFREARLLGALDHPGIVRGIDAGSTDDCSWFAMEYVEGRTLADVLAKEGPPPLARVVALALEILDALGHAHARGIVHRDLKPSNILIDRSGRARVLDLGLALRDADPRQSFDGGALGTPKYMAPEQARAPETVDGRADLFALAGVIYTAIAGQPPFQGVTVAEVLTRVLYDDPAPLSELRIDVSDAFAAVVQKALAKNPDHRFPDAAAFSSALRAVMRPGAVFRTESAARHRRRSRAIAATVVLLLGATMFIWARLAGRADPDPRPPATPAAGAAAPAPPAVADFLPSVAPELMPLERATRALEAARAAPFEGADLEACLAPLKAELFAAAERLRRTALASARRGDSAAARTMIRRAGPALLAEVAPDGSDPPPALRALAEDAAASVADPFEREFATEQADLAADAQRRLDELLADPASDTWTRTEQARRIATALSGALGALEGSERDSVERKASAVASKLAVRPALGFDRRLKEAEAHLEAGRFASARARLAPWLRGEGEESVGGSTAQARRMIEAAEIRERSVLDGAYAAPDRLARGDVLSLDAANRRARADLVESEANKIRASAGESAAFAEAAAFLTSTASAARAAATLREDLLARLGEGPPADPNVKLATRKDGALSMRALVGRDGAAVVMRRPVDGLLDRLQIGDLASSFVADALSAYGAPPSPLATALSEHWDGDDVGASNRLAVVRGLVPEAVRARLAGIVDAAFETDRARLETDAERAALKSLLDARRRRGEGDAAGAADQVRPLAARPKLRATEFWRRYGKEIERILVRAGEAEERAARLRTFGETPRVFVAAKRTLKLDFQFKTGGVIDGVMLPPGASRDAEGLRWPGAPDAPAGFPEQAPALRIPASAAIAASEASIRCEILSDRGSAPPFIALTWCDATLLVFGSLRDFGAFAGVPLHGLERDLLRAKDVDRAVCLFGGVAEARRRLIVEGSAVRSLGGRRPFFIGMDAGGDGAAVGFVEDVRFSARGVRPRPAGFQGLELRLPPNVVLKSVTLELPAGPAEDE